MSWRYSNYNCSMTSYLHRTLNLTWVIISPFLARLIYRSSGQKRSLYKFACDFIMRLWCSYKGDWLWQNNKKTRSERWMILTCHIVSNHTFFAIRYSYICIFTWPITNKKLYRGKIYSSTYIHWAHATYRICIYWNWLFVNPYL